MISTTASAVNDDDSDGPFTFETMMVNWHSFLQTGDDESDDYSGDDSDDGDDVMMMLTMMIMIDR